jgi:hypothetical protein
MPGAGNKKKSGEYCRSNFAWLVEVHTSRSGVSVGHGGKILIKLVDSMSPHCWRNDFIISESLPSCPKVEISLQKDQPFTEAPASTG